MKKDGNKLRGLPTVSGPGSRQGQAGSVAQPQIEGYEIIDQLGESGQGRVWRAVQLSTRREVALKVPLVSLLKSKKALTRFEREVELAARLKHPNIARIYDSGIYQGLYYYAMELIERATLDEYLENHALTQRQVVELMRTICQAVQHAHQNGVIHRDIKSSNILLTEDGQPHIVDFGLATNILESDQYKTVSAEGEVAGTPAYMSPEQAAGHHESLDTRTDVYSIGVVFYRSLTDSFPYDVNTSMYETLRNIQETEPLRPSDLVPKLDSDIETVVLKALAKEADERYQSVAELQHDIERWLDGMPILARSDSSIYVLRKLIAKHRYTSAVVGLLLVITVAFTCLSLQLYGRLRRSNDTLQETNQSLYQEIEQYMDLAQQMSISRFLQQWHENRYEAARTIASFFGRGGKEARAAGFLLSQTPLEEKIPEFRQGLLPSEICFGEYIIAEHHYKNKDWLEAADAYERCLSYVADLEENQWLSTQARSRLYELSREHRTTGTFSAVKETGP
ncbi:MAG: serine/threonine protein kinase [Planctomycetota bacterium]